MTVLKCSLNIVQVEQFNTLIELLLKAPTFEWHQLWYRMERSKSPLKVHLTIVRHLDQYIDDFYTVRPSHNSEHLDLLAYLPPDLRSFWIPYFTFNRILMNLINLLERESREEFIRRFKVINLVVSLNVRCR